MYPETTLLPEANDGLSGVLHSVILFIQGYIMIVIMGVGVLGNGLSILVFYRARRRNDATIHYLSALAVSDTSCIVFVGLVFWTSNGLQTITNGELSINLFHISTLSCKILHYLFLLLQSISAWIIAIFSLERAVVVWFPLKRSSITATKRKGVLVMMCFVLSSTSIFSAILSDVLDHGGEKQCFYDPSLWLILFLVENAMYYFVPGFAIFTANIAIFIGIAVSSNRTASIKAGQKEPEAKERRSLINLFIVSAMFLIFLTPSTVTWTYFILQNQVIEPSHAMVLNDLGELFHQWSMINYCFNFIVYSISLPFYQAEIKALVRFLPCGHQLDLHV